MLVTLRYEDIAGLVNEGSVVTITGTTLQQDRVTFGADTRTMDPVLQMLALAEEDEITVLVDDWQILDVDAYEPCCLGHRSGDHEPGCPYR